jgi:hypothetical protein
LKAKISSSRSGGGGGSGGGGSGGGGGSSFLLVASKSVLVAGVRAAQLPNSEGKSETSLFY